MSNNDWLNCGFGIYLYTPLGQFTEDDLCFAGKDLEDARYLIGHLQGSRWWVISCSFDGGIPPIKLELFTLGMPEWKVLIGKPEALLPEDESSQLEEFTREVRVSNGRALKALIRYLAFREALDRGLLESGATVQMDDAPEVVEAFRRIDNMEHIGAWGLHNDEPEFLEDRRKPLPQLTWEAAQLLPAPTPTV